MNKALRTILGIALAGLISSAAIAKPGDEEFIFGDDNLPVKALQQRLNREAATWSRLSPRPTPVTHFHDALTSYDSVQSWVVMRNPDDRRFLDVLVQFKGSTKFVTIKVRLNE